ncbi:uncharacterized protein LOC113872222 isoform X2 [Abrus precatorius]|uniref:Uncharacterized protein LOC113872222 isoform X2 n=1 Tax=Abrus precatorius TaxID=3816 RepID=A0A8B8MC41_ABRPR|nr:uncharacterized protein LOC113872222 isoform X2 [Abrus precatorius]
MDGDNDPSTLAWLWGIEALASFKQIPTSTLQPPVELDDFSETTRELVAIKCLEELFGYAGEVDPSTLDSRVGFDFSRSCEDVLEEILREITPSNLDVAAAELLKWDIYPFIEHKRAGIKCYLEQLKESILEGTHPHTDELRERSGLFPQNSSYIVHVNEVECDAQSEKDDGNSTDSENMGEKENLVSLILQNGSKSSKEHLIDDSLILENGSKSSKEHLSDDKTNGVYSADDHLMGHNEKRVCMDECDDLLRTSKRIKCNGCTSFESQKEKPVSQLEYEVSETSTERIVQISETVGHHTEKNNNVTLATGSLEESHNTCSASNLRQSSCHNEMFRDESNIPFNTTLMAQHTFGGENSQQQLVEIIPTNVELSDGIQDEVSGSKPCHKHETDSQLEDLNGSQQTVATVKAPENTCNSCEVTVTGDMIVYQAGKINLSMKKHEEQNLNMKCNDGSRLLVCDATTVPPVFPEICLDMTTTLMSPNTAGAEPCGNKFMHEATDTHHVEPLPTNDNNTDKIEHLINEFPPNQKEPNVASLNFSHKPVAGDKPVVDTVNDCGEELSSGSDGYHNERNDIAAKKHEFLSSHFPFDQDFSAMAKSTELNRCMKCNEGGQLLACKTTTCSLMVHKSCVGASAQLDAKGNFICSFCEYSRTISEYLEAKKEASMARKELSIFISKGIKTQAAELVHEFCRQDHSLSEKSSSKCENIHVQKNGDDRLNGCEDNREVHFGEHANETNSLQFERSQQQAPISCVHSSFKEKEYIINKLGEVSREEEIGEMPNAMILTGGIVEEMEVPNDSVDGHDDDKFTSGKTSIVYANQSYAQEVPKEMTLHDMKETLEPVCAHDSGKGEISEDESEKHIASRYSMRMRKHETQDKSQASPPSRRKIIPWTVEEEELIMEGLQKFGCNESKIPWKKILAFGAHVFEKDNKCRTPQDLKDKWKNMCKSQSKSK